MLPHDAEVSFASLCKGTTVASKGIQLDLQGRVTTSTSLFLANQVYERLEEIGAHGAEARAGAILAGLCFEPDMQQRATRTFSGGWRMRIAVCHALVPLHRHRSCTFVAYSHVAWCQIHALLVASTFWLLSST